MSQGKALALFLVRGHDVDGENQDWFVVATGPDRASDLWNDYLITNGFPRNDGDDEYQLPRQKTVDPENIREVLDDVSGTKYDGAERVVEWDELTIVA